MARPDLPSSTPSAGFTSGSLHLAAKMRKHDLDILLLTAFAIFFSLQHEGDFSFREAWYHLSDEGYPIKHDADRLPPPLVADLNKIDIHKFGLFGAIILL
ncbi:hypothetical protein D1007_08609 [Hordeum vulgare]|nr:hypothetical protein D1007_08609 [Hordeum vulgare]